MKPNEIDLVLLSIANAPGINVARELDERHREWCRHVANMKPGLNMDDIARQANLIIAAARQIGMQSPIDPNKLAPYFLGITLRWLYQGTVSFDTIMDRLPKTADGVGTMVLAEGLEPHTGKPLTGSELKKAQQGGKLKLQ